MRRYGEAFSAAWAARHSNEASSRRSGEAEFLPELLEIQESPPNPLARKTVYVIILFFLIAMVWMLVGTIDIVATARGKIIPDNRIKVVQSVEAGVVRKILAEDGDKVTAGQPLLLLDITSAEADIAVIEEALSAAILEEEMAKLLSRTQTDISPTLAVPGVERGRLLRQQEVMERIYQEQRGRIGKLRSDMEALQRGSNIERQGAEDAGVRMTKVGEVMRQKEEGELRRISKIEQLLKLAKDEFVSMNRLLEEQVISKRQMQQSQEKYVSLREDLSYRRNALEEIRADSVRQKTELEQIASQHGNRALEMDARLDALRQSLRLEESAFQREMRDRQEAAAREIEQRRQEMIKLRQLRQRHEIISPANGVVQEMAVHTEGAVVQPAQPLLVIVPENLFLEAEVLVENKDVGFVYEGQKAEIKIDTFPYTKYGLINGEVSYLSADAVEDQNLGLLYQARIRLDSDIIVVGGKDVRLSPGMSLVAEIKTGDRRVIDFFLAPLLRHGSESLGER